MMSFSTDGFNGYARIACASAANYGIIGNGRLFVLDNTTSSLQPVAVYDTQDALYDCSWAENHENLLVTAAGDGSILLWDVTLQSHPVAHWKEHEREVMAVDWNLVKKDTFLSASWDAKLKLWDPAHKMSLQTFHGHSACIYAVSWSPSHPDSFVSASGDSTVKLWDVRRPEATLSFVAGEGECLSVDWNKYQQNQIVTAGVDKCIRTWDLRQPNRPIATLLGHNYAVRRVRCSPHSPTLVASCSYDMTWRLWDLNAQKPVFVHDKHSEFVIGLDFSLFEHNLVASCSWDQHIYLVRI